MDSYIITGGNRLNGKVSVSAAKNVVLPIIACSLMSKDDIILKNCERLKDVEKMLDIAVNLGGKAYFDGNSIHINCKDLQQKPITSEYTSQIRSSIFILGPLLTRFGYAEISHPGGCEIGLRPIDLHLEGLRMLGVNITEKNGIIICDGSNMKSADIYLDFPSVGATENIIMASVQLNGTTIIRNAAKEPEIRDLAKFINMLGGRVFGAGSDTICVEGVRKLGGGIYNPISDRIITGTIMSACAVCGGEILIDNCDFESINALIDKFRQSGCKIKKYGGSILFASDERPKSIRKIETQPFPGFPTDMQPQMCAMLAYAKGVSVMVENVFENRFKYTMQLKKAGADITVKDRVAIIKGRKTLHGCTLLAEDLRGGAALVVAALGAEGKSEVVDVRHIDRGYYMLENTLNSLGADMRRVRKNVTICG